MTERKMTTNAVLEAIARERARLDAAGRALGADASTVPVTEEGWTTKDVFAHLIHWASQIAFGLGAKLEPPPYVLIATDGPKSDHAWNARAVAYWGDSSADEVKAEFDRVVDALVAQIRQRTDDQINATDAIPWAGPRPLWQQIASETFEHWPEHTAAIERAAAARVT